MTTPKATPVGPASVPSKESTRGARAEELQEAVWRGQSVDRLPLLIEVSGQPWDGKEHTLEEQVADPRKMAEEALRAVEAQCPVVSDSVLCVRPQFGVGLFATPFGVEYELSARYATPWVKSTPPKEHLSGLGTGDLDIEGSTIGQSAEVLRLYRDTFQGAVETFLPDTQGPFDIAHQARGHDIFTDIFDDPPFVHHLMELATHTYIEGTRLLKQAGEEGPSEGHHSGCLRMVDCGVRMCDDSGVILSPTQYAEFVGPYHERALAAFGGGWAHWCGDAPHLTDAYLAMESCKGINLGQPELYDQAELLSRVVAAGKVYFGLLHRRAEESAEDFLSRVLRDLGGERRGLILICPPRQDESKEGLMDLWAELQEAGQA
jgi:hypothetical protein